MFLYQFVDLDPKEIEKVKKIALENLPKPTDLVFNSLKPPHNSFMGRQLSNFVIVKVKPNQTVNLHKDYGQGIALNIPLLNCDKTKTEMWETYCEWFLFNHPGDPYLRPAESNPVKIKLCEFILSGPAFFNTAVAHSIYNYGDKVRTAISLRFKDDPLSLINY